MHYNTYVHMLVVYVRNNQMYFVKNSGGIRYGPLVTTNYIPPVRVPEPVDAAFGTTKINGHEMTVMFAGEKYVFQVYVSVTVYYFIVCCHVTFDYFIVCCHVTFDYFLVCCHVTFDYFIV